MRRLAIGLSFVFFAVTAAHAQQVSTDLSKAPSGPLEMDARHTQVLFTIMRGGLVNVYGRFDKNSGTLDFDNTAPEKSSVSVTVDMTSISMMVSELDTSLQGKEVFDTADYPTATFKSTSATRTGPTTGTLTGDLTFRGITKPVTFAVTYVGSNGNQLGFHAVTTIKRSDFNMTGMRFNSLISDDVQLIIEGLFQKPRAAPGGDARPTRPTP